MIELFLTLLWKWINCRFSHAGRTLPSVQLMKLKDFRRYHKFPPLTKVLHRVNSSILSKSWELKLNVLANNIPKLTISSQNIVIGIVETEKFEIMEIHTIT